MQEASERWDAAFEAWRDGDYATMLQRADQGRRDLRGEAGDPAVGDAPSSEALQAPGFPWLVVAVTAALAVAAWAMFLGWQARRPGAGEDPSRH